MLGYQFGDRVSTKKTSVVSTYLPRRASREMIIWVLWGACLGVFSFLCSFAKMTGFFAFSVSWPPVVCYPWMGVTLFVFQMLVMNCVVFVLFVLWVCGRHAGLLHVAEPIFRVLGAEIVGCFWRCCKLARRLTGDRKLAIYFGLRVFWCRRT